VPSSRRRYRSAERPSRCSPRTTKSPSWSPGSPRTRRWEATMNLNKQYNHFLGPEVLGLPRCSMAGSRWLWKAKGLRWARKCEHKFLFGICFVLSYSMGLFISAYWITLLFYFILVKCWDNNLGLYCEKGDIALIYIFKMLR
jgi:hypothetical protein